MQEEFFKSIDILEAFKYKILNDNACFYAVYAVFYSVASASQLRRMKTKTMEQLFAALLFAVL